VGGCDAPPQGQLNGRVTYQGAPVAGAEMLFASTTEENSQFSGVSGTKGEYYVSYVDPAGLPPGRYKITITVYTIPAGVP
jgi:hypothetical protein